MYLSVAKEVVFRLLVVETETKSPLTRHDVPLDLQRKTSPQAFGSCV